MSSEPDIIVLMWLLATLRSATPLLFVTLGETIAQRTGVINLGIEGEMLAGACVGFAMVNYTGNPWLGLLSGGLAGAALSLFYAALVLGTRANQIASGLAVWMFALGMTSYFGRSLVGKQVVPLPTVSLTGEDNLSKVGALAQFSPATLFAIILIPLAYYFFQYTRWGLHWRATGESAAISSENGIRTHWVRVQGLLVGGLFAGVGGAVLSIDYTQTWAQEITKGTGLIAVGLVIVARWNPLWVLPVCLLFGFTEVSVLRLQSMGTEQSSYFLSTLPYITVLVILILSHQFKRLSSGMPADLKSIFK